MMYGYAVMLSEVHVLKFMKWIWCPAFTVGLQTPPSNRQNRLPYIFEVLLKNSLQLD